MLKKLKKHKFIAVIVLIVFIYLAAQFVYINIIVPWPYRQELKTCINKAKQFPTKSQVEEARYKCFRTYPHFN